MKRDALLLAGLLFCLLFASKGLAQMEAPDAPETPGLSGTEEMLRSNLHLQEQLHHSLRAIEQARKDADDASKQTAELFTEKTERC